MRCSGRIVLVVIGQRFECYCGWPCLSDTTKSIHRLKPLERIMNTFPPCKSVCLQTVICAHIWLLVCLIDKWRRLLPTLRTGIVQPTNKIVLQTRSSWFNCALRDDEAVNWVSIGHYEAVAVGNWFYWVSRWHFCLYILNTVEIWTGVTHWLTQWLTTLKDRATQLLIKYKSWALVIQL